MKIADLYLKLGIDGAGDVSKGLGKISGSLKELFSMSIQTKLTLGSIVAGLTGASISFGRTAMGLSQFANTFGLSTKTLQQWQQAAEIAGVGADEVAGSIGKIQDAMTDAMLHGGMNEAFTKLAIDPRQFKDAFGVIEELRKRIQGGQIDVMRAFSSGLIDENMFQMLRQIKNPTEMKPIRHIMTEGEVKSGQQLAVQFDRFGKDLKRMMDEFVVQNKDLILEVLNLLKTFLKEAMKLMLDISKMFGFDKEKQKLPESQKIDSLVKEKYTGGILDRLNPFKGGVKVGDAIFKALGFADIKDEKIARQVLMEQMIQDALKPKQENYLPDDKDFKGWTEYKNGNTSTFIINGANVDEKTSESWKKETANVFRQIAGAK